MVKIYKISCENNKIYIGSTNRSLRVRLNEHRCHNSSLKNSRDLKIEELEECPMSRRYERENFYIRKYKSKTSGYNRCLASTGPLGYKRTKRATQRAIKTMQDKMLYFKITNKTNNEESLITNSYDRAASYTSQSRDSVRKKLRNSRQCNLYKYQYVTGGELSQ